MTTYKTPGVYVEEISTLPPSVAEVSTAVPAFIGYTQKSPVKGSRLARINTLLEYESLFGKARPSEFSVTTHRDPDTRLQMIDSVKREDPSPAEFLLYYSVSLYFKNGGGSCYIISIGDYDSAPAREDFEDGLGLLETEDEPTLILFPDAVNLPDEDYHSLCQQALAQCAKLGDRFTILDVKDGDVAAFRDGVGTNHLMYGAAYHPYLQTVLSYQYQEDSIQVTRADEPAGPATTTSTWESAFGGIIVSFTGNQGTTPQVQITKGTSAANLKFTIAADGRQLTIASVADSTAEALLAKWIEWKNVPNDAAGFNIQLAGDGSAAIQTTGTSVANLISSASGEPSDTDTNTLASIRSTETALYNQIKTALAAERVVLPPSAAIAGIYASVDRARGVWKAPANLSIAAVIGPVAKISHDDQEQLNVDPTAGKSINAIRAFTGKGTLVWGARTLAGNDNEWRYVSVRRLFIMIEESAKKSTAFAVFEPNDATTWLKVKGMIESYLYGLWERGALAGPTPESAYFVNVGLGKTMTPQDVLEGRMIVEIGIAAVRPAEFIILRFTHMLQQA
jgi:uncharacterized protein